MATKTDVQGKGLQREWCIKSLTSPFLAFDLKSVVPWVSGHGLLRCALVFTSLPGQFQRLVKGDCVVVLLGWQSPGSHGDWDTQSPQATFLLAGGSSEMFVELNWMVLMNFKQGFRWLWIKPSRLSQPPVAHHQWKRTHFTSARKAKHLLAQTQVLCRASVAS
jgi:hypothetical protein